MLTSCALIRCQTCLMLQNNDKAQGSCENKLAVTSQVRLSFASTYYTMAQALGIQKLQDFIRVSNAQGIIANKMSLQTTDLCAGITFVNNFTCANLAFGCQVRNHSTRARWSRSISELHIISCCYAEASIKCWYDKCVSQVLDSVTEDFQSIIWMSYRKAFAPLGMLPYGTNSCRTVMPPL